MQLDRCGHLEVLCLHFQERTELAIVAPLDELKMNILVAELENSYFWLLNGAIESSVRECDPVDVNSALHFVCAVVFIASPLATARMYLYAVMFYYFCGILWATDWVGAGCLCLTTVQDETLPQPDSTVERVIAQHLPGNHRANSQKETHAERM